MQGKRHRTSYRAHLFALEPRMMFDAAAAIVAHDALTGNEAPTADSSHSDAAHPFSAEPASRDAARPGFADRAAIDSDDGADHDTVYAASAPIADQPASATDRAIIFIDTSVADYRQLASEWSGRGEVVLIDGTRDGIEQMRSALAGRSDLSAIHIVSHGSAGVLQLGTTRIDGDAIDGNLAGSLAAIGRSLSADGDILIYGCDFAAGADGARALAAFAHVTGADVAASTDTTGYAGRGGDWTLESHDGSVEAMALSSRDWVHTLDPNTPVPISVAVNSLTVRDGGGNVVFSTADNYNNNAARSPDVGVGATATWINAATYQGNAVSLRATVVSLTSGDAVQFNRVTGTGTGPDDPTFLLRDLTTGNTPATVQVRWELIDQATGNPLPADVRFTIADIDGIGGNPNSRETVTASTDHLAYFTRERISDINFTSSLGAITASGTQDENNPVGATLTSKSAATFDWSDVSSFVLTYTLTPNAQTTQAQFYHDGDADFVYDDPVYVSIPRLDLDGDNSTASGNDALHTFTEGGASVPIVDSDIVVENPMPSEGITGATVHLTNWHTGDSFTVGTLPAGLTATIGAVSGGTQTITITGNGSEADYAAAFQAIMFANSSDAPNTDQRVIEVTFSNDTLTSATAISRINVIPVNDAPVRVGTLPARTTADAATVSYTTAGGFSDPDGDTLTYSATGLPAGLTINSATGVISGTINRSASQTNGGLYTVIVTARDPSTAGQTQTFTITVANPAPVAVDDANTNVVEDGSVTIAVLTNDYDPDGDPLTVTGVSALHGAVIVNGDNTVTYTPDADYNGPDTITYTISDGQGGTDTATAAITVTPVNDPVVANGSLSNRSSQDSATVNYPTAGGFYDPDGEALTYTATGLPAGLTIDSATGLISGTIHHSASQTTGGVYTVVVTARDAANSSATQTFTLTITNPTPTAVNDSATTPEDTPITIAVLSNDTDPDGDPLTITAASALHGSVVRNANGTLTYSPDADYNGPDTITYTISDGEGGTSTATVAVTVTPVNDPPVAVGTLPDRNGVDNTAASFATAGGFNEPEGQTLTYSATGLPAGLTIDSATGVISGTIDRAASQPGGGVYTVVVTARDPGNATATQTFTYTVTNPPPTANNDGATTAEDTPVTISVLTNDTDPDGDPLSVTAASALHGSVVRNSDGTITYTPDTDYNGSDTITYTISDGNGGTSTATVAVTITPVNDGPTPVGTLPARSDADNTSVSFGTAMGFNDPEGDAVTYAASGLPAGLSIDTNTGVVSGSLGRSASQVGGGVYTVVITATDSFGASRTQTFTYTITNPAPTAVNDSATTVEDTPVTITVLTNDSDPDGDPLSVIAASALHGSVIRNGDGTITYTPDDDYNGSDTITYTISDGEGGTATATVAVTITPTDDAPVAVGALPARNGADGAAVSFGTASGFADPDGDALTYTATGLPTGLTINAATGVVSGTIDRSASQVGGGVYSVTVTARDPGGLSTSQTFSYTVTNPAPTAINDTASTAEDTPVTITVLTNDSDPDGDPLTVVSASALHGVVTINPDGTLGYAPAANYNGTDTITYQITDGQGGFATATVAVTLTPVNDAPVATGTLPARNGADGSPTSVPTASGFSDIDGDALTYSATGLPTGLSIDPVTGVISGTVDRSASQVGGGVYTVVVTARDAANQTATQQFTFTATNPGPDAVDDAITTSHDRPVDIVVLANDSDPDGDPLVVTSANASHGSATVLADGSIRYTPTVGFQGVDTITYTISDGQGGTDTATVTVTVGNSAPATTSPAPAVAANDGDVVSLPIGGQFSDADGDTLTFSATGLPPGLTIDPATGTVTGTITRSASQTNGGVYDAIVTANDGAGGVTSVTVRFTVGNPAPVAVNDSVTTSEDTPVTIAVLTNDSDPDGDPLTVVSASALHGAVTINPDGSLRYVPNADFSGTDTITYTIDDGQGGRATAIVAVTVTAINDAPRAQPIASQASRDGQAIALDTASHFSDPERDTLSYSATGLPPGLTIDPATGQISGTIAPSASAAPGGLYRVTITASDGQLTTALTFDWTVANPPPVAADDSARTLEDTAVVIPVLANDSDPDGDPLTVLSARADHGIVAIGSDGQLTYTPGPNFAGQDVITYTIDDGNGGRATAIVTVAVDPVNDAPLVPQNGMLEATSGRPLTIDALRGVTDADGDPLSVIAASTANGTVTINPDGTLRFTPTLGFVGTTTITFRVSDGQGGIGDGVLVVDVTAPQATDIQQLLRIGQVTFLNPTPSLATITVPDGEVRNPLTLLDTVEQIRDLNSTAIGHNPVGDAVNAIRSLNGTFIDPDYPVTAEVARLDRLVDRRDAGDRLFDHRWSDFQVKSLTGFSAAADRNAGVMVESVVRDGAIYLEVRDTAEDSRAGIRSVDVRTANGGPAPSWIKVDRRGLAIIERGAGMDELHLIVRVTREDGRVTSTPIVVQGATGEIELDRHHKTHGRAQALDQTLQTPSAAQQAIAARLASSFE